MTNIDSNDEYHATVQHRADVVADQLYDRNQPSWHVCCLLATAWEVSASLGPRVLEINHFALVSPTLRRVDTLLTYGIEGLI